uniref:palmitoyl-protein hydrolase n=1 Tax=Oncorhynchus kisutch TaxID=8019 RepID=A0A8C7HDE7_ONCKI
MDPNNTSYAVKLYVYDISKGMARQLSPLMLGKLLTHTAIVVHGEEFFYGGDGITNCRPVRQCFILFLPNKLDLEISLYLGTTEVTEEILWSTCRHWESPRETNYHLFEWNCNTFQSPGHITDLPAEVLSTDMVKTIPPLEHFHAVSPLPVTQIYFQ